MGILVFEGPDGSGKTTLARMIYQQLIDHGFKEVEYQRSPVKEHGWSPEYNNYLSDQIRTQEQFNSPKLLIQDRIPEISELIYGTYRGHCRCRGYSYDLYNWMGHDLMMVFCAKPPYSYTSIAEDHIDAEGQRLELVDRQTIGFLYDQVYTDVSQSVIWSKAPMKVLYYNRYVKGHWIKTADKIQWWLLHQVPDQSKAIMDGLSFSIDSKFPNLEEI